MMQIGKLGKKAGVSTRAIRYYDRIGLLGATERSPSGYRLYGEEVVGFLQFVKKAQRVGFTLEEIKTIREIRISGMKPCGYVREHAQKKVEEIELKIRELEDLRKTLMDIQKESEALEPVQDQGQSICPLIEGI
jgi:DNA-binding transcriptional MerR regulator